MKKIDFFKLFLALNMLLFLAGCVLDDESASVDIRKEDVTPSYSVAVDDVTIVSDGEVETVSDDASLKLKGTCPRGQHCLSPHCHLWSDLNSDGACDRGAV